MSKKIKVGLVGCGGIAKGIHIPAYQKIENAEVVATCDILKDRAESAAKTLGAADVFTDYRKLIELKEIDMVDVCTPNYLHSDVAVAALNAGKHVFCEKPDAITVEKAIAMKEASEKAGKHLMVMRNWRYNANCNYVKDYIESGKCGELYTGRCGWIRRRGIPGKGGWFTTKAQSGGGALIDLGVHLIDLSIWMMGNPKPVSVSGSTYCKFAGNEEEADSEHAKFGDANKGGTFDVEDLAIGFIKFANGASLQFEFSWASNIEAELGFVEMRGTKAGYKWEGTGSQNNSLTLFTDDYIMAKPMLVPNTPMHMLNIKHFIDDVLIAGKEPKFKPAEGVEMIKILTGIYKSAETGKEVILN